MTYGSRWTRQQLLVAFGLYCQLPFRRFNSRNPDIIKFAEAIGRTPSALAMKLGNIASLDPAITSTGRVGLRGGVSANDRAMWDEMQSDWERFAIESERTMMEVISTAETDSSADQDRDRGIVGTDREVRTTARIGQDFFRSAILSAYNGRCCITGLSLPALLVASHIVPWSHDKSNRVNPQNGLLLTALHDKAFDSGLITLNDDMTVQISGKYTVVEDPFFSESIKRYDGCRISVPEKFIPDQDFLSYHREYIFQG